MPDDDNLSDLEVVARDRPALLIQDGDFGAAPPDWEILNEKRARLRDDIIPFVGRVEIVEENRSVGTAFVAGDGILMTNTHVVRTFASLDGLQWKIRPGTTVRVDFRREHDRSASNVLPVEGVIGADANLDLALLRVDAERTRKGLVLERNAPDPVGQREVVVIGYADFDASATAEQVTRIFNDILGVKRLQPGRTTRLLGGNPPILGHDCSTLGGNSGSCVVDLATGRVIALHIGGTVFSGNRALPLWRVSDQPWLKDLSWVRKGRAAHH
jgi:glutamyl endopeptidase